MSIASAINKVKRVVLEFVGLQGYRSELPFIQTDRHTHTKKDLGKSKASKTQIKFTTPCNLLDDPGY